MGRLVSALTVVLLTISSSAQWMGRPTDVPAYSSVAPKKGEKLPPILRPAELNLTPSKFNAAQKRSYVLAARIPRVIYQQPCYCYCDRAHGHKSLHTCFESVHGSTCGVCMKEVFYSYQMTKLKKTPAQIRQGIVAGEWQSVDLEKAVSIN